MLQVSMAATGSRQGFKTTGAQTTIQVRLRAEIGAGEDFCLPLRAFSCL
jgi:hypothetical protein